MSRGTPGLARPRPGVRDVLASSIVPLVNCILILAVMGYSRLPFPPRELACVGVLFSLMMVWPSLRHAQNATRGGRLACWSLYLLSSIFLVSLLLLGR